MSLIHWWTLMEDNILDNITGIPLTAKNVIATDNKLGRGYGFTPTTDSRFIIDTNNFHFPQNHFTITLWFKYNSWNTSYATLFALTNNPAWAGNICTIARAGSSSAVHFCISDGSNYTASSCNTGELTLGRWYHLAAVYSEDKMQLYLDGELKNTYNNPPAPNFNLVNNGNIGRLDSTYYQTDSQIQDVRMYDHALSQAEVRELSKALVVHYTFSDTLSEPTTNIDPCKDSLITHTYPGASLGAISCTYGHFHGCDCVEMHLNATYSSTTWIYMNSNPISQGAKVGDTVTRSCWMYIPSGQTKPPHFTESIEGNSSSQKFVQYDYNKCDTWQRVSMTGTIADTGTNNYLHYFMAGSGTVNFKWYMKDFQMEIKDHATSYTPGSRSSLLYNETGLIQPSTKNNIVLSPDSGVGTYSLNCQGSTEIATSNVCDILQGTTTSFWVKGTIPADSRVVFADSNSNTAFGFFNNGQAIITCAGYGHACVSNIKTGWNTEWNHIVVTRDSSGNVSCYLNNNKLTLSGSQEWTHSIENTLSIGCRYNGGWTSYYTGLIDDFRFYAICLTADDIKDLYQTKAYISDKGDIMCSEFIEGESQAQVTSKGTFEAKEFYEEIDTPSGYDRLSYIQSTGTQYIDTGVSLGTSMVFNVVVSDVVDNAYVITQGNYGLRYLWGTFVNFVSGKRFRGTISTQAGVVNRVKGSNEYINIDGVQGTQESDNDNPSGNIMISKSGGCKIYECRLYNNDAPVRCYIPVKRQSDNMLGLYDTINNVLYTNAGTDTFIAGPVVTNTNASIYSTHIVSCRNLKEI